MLPQPYCLLQTSQKSPPKFKVLLDDNPKEWRKPALQQPYGDFTLMFFEKNWEFGAALKVIKVELWTQEGEQPSQKAALLKAQLVKRGKTKENFFCMCDAYSQELQEAAVSCCDHSGKVRSPLADTLQSKSRVTAASQGGFLYVEEVSVAATFQRRDLGLHLVLHLFRYLGKRWSLAALFPTPWSAADRMAHQHLCREVDKAVKRRKTERIGRHYARIGFRQISECRCTFWFLERDAVPDQPLGREEVDEAHLQLYQEVVLAEPHVPEGLDAELCEHVYALDGVVSCIAKGAQPNRCFALHHAAAKGGLDVLRFLVAAGADVNLKDFQGYTPLLIAVSGGRVEAVELLLQLGSDASIVEKHGLDALGVAKRSKQSLVDFSNAFGLRGAGENCQKIISMLEEAGKS